ncbi:unnamed protein product, partial [Didymodactylos carnosus]
GAPYDNDKYWWISINGQSIEKGACQQEVKTGDTILFELVDSMKNCELEISDETIQMDKPETVK